VQRRYRGMRSYRLIKLAVMAQARIKLKQHKAAVLMQRRWRGIFGRRKFSLLSAYKRVNEITEKNSATQLQVFTNGNLSNVSAF